MSLLVILGIAVGLSMDAMSVAIATSLMLGRPSGGQIFRFAFNFGLFQALMPVAGWFAGREIEPYIRTWDHWVASLLLFFIGAKAVIEALRNGQRASNSPDPTRGASLLLLSVATSIDALAVGLNFGLLDVPIWYPAPIIGLVTASLVTLGMLLSRLIGRSARRSLQVAGGLILVAIGLKILIEHLRG